MTEHPFHPESIEEQIDQFSSSSQHRSADSDTDLLHDARLILASGDVSKQSQEDRDSLQRVWTDITAKGIQTQATRRNQLRRPTERFTVMSTPSSMPERPTTPWGRRLGLLSVAAVVVVLLGSAFVVFTTAQRGQVAQQPSTHTGAGLVTTPTAPPPIDKQGTTVYTYQQPGYGIYGLQWSQDGQRIISTNNNAYGWDALNGAHVIKYVSTVPDLQKKSTLLFARLSPNGKQLAVWHTTTIELYDVATGKKIKTFSYNFPTDPNQRNQFSPYLSWTADGKAIKAIAQIAENNETIPSISKLVTYNVAAGKIQQEVGLNVKGVLDRVSWSPNGRYVAAGLGSSGTVYVFNIVTGKTVSSHFGSGPTETIELSWSPDSKRIAASFDNGIHVWDAATEQHVAIYQGGWNPVWSPNGKYIAVVDGTPSVIRILNATTGKTLYTYKEHTGAVYDLAWSPDSVYIASGEGGVNENGEGTGDSGTVRVWVARP